MPLATLCSTLELLKHRASQLATRKAYTREDVHHFKGVLLVVERRRQSPHGPTPASKWEAARFDRLFRECTDLMGTLGEPFVEMAASLRPTYESLLDVRTRLQSMARQPHSVADLEPIQTELDAIDTKRMANNGVFGGNIASGDIPAGQAACSELLYECYELVAELEQSAIDMDPAVARVCFELAGIWMYLEHMRTEKHTMDDLRHYQNLLDAIDSKRVDGIICGDLQHVPAGQARALEILQSNYDLIEKLKQTAVELGPAMQKIVHSLTKLRADLEAVHHRPHTSGEVATIQGHLDKVDAERKGGVFAGNLTHVPPGQATCSTLLHQCYYEVEQALATASDAAST